MAVKVLPDHDLTFKDIYHWKSRFKLSKKGEEGQGIRAKGQGIRGIFGIRNYKGLVSGIQPPTSDP
jgi:hypothetical protein